MSSPRKWHVPPGRTIDLPDGIEFMRGGLGYWIYYNPRLNHSYYITGSDAAGWDVIDYPYPLCGLCWERHQEYRHGI